MKNIFALLLILSLPCLGVAAQPDKPLRIFIRAGVKTHGPGQHDHPRFLKEWKELLNQRGAQADGAIGFPSAEQLAATDVLILIAADAGDINPDQRANLDQFLKRGGGLVVIHDGVCGHDPQWFKTIIGGAWEYKHAGYFEGDISLYYQDHAHPITRGASDFHFDDEMYYDLHLMPEAHILAGTHKPDARNQHPGPALPPSDDIVPQMWTYEKDDYRAFVCIPGHNYKTFNLPHFRAVLLRGIAWAGKREADSLASKEELASLSSPEGGFTAPNKTAEIEWGQGIRVLSVGGGTSHDFNRWFNQVDSVTLGADAGASFHYTENVAELLPALKDLDVLYLSSNQPLTNPLLRQAVFDFADAGHGFLLFHPALWNNWKDWPEYNRVLVGGVAGSHDKYGEFEVTLTDANHPLLAGVPKTFRLKDELYHFEADPKAAHMRVLAEGRNLATGKTYPVLWIVEHPKARIVCCTLGHDGQSHDLAAFKTILQNGLHWAGGK